MKFGSSRGRVAFVHSSDASGKSHLDYDAIHERAYSPYTLAIAPALPPGPGLGTSGEGALHIVPARRFT